MANVDFDVCSEHVRSQEVLGRPDPDALVGGGWGFGLRAWGLGLGA